MAYYKNTSGQKVNVFAYDKTTGAAKTGDAANITAYLSKDGGAAAAVTDTNPTELDATNMPGWYVFDLTQAETNAEVLVIAPKSSTANILIDQVQIFTETVSAAVAAVPAAVWAVGTRTLTAFGFSVTVGTNNDKSGYSLSAAGVQAIWDALTSALTTVGSIGKRIVDNLDVAISSRLAAAGYTAPNNADITAIKAKTDNLPASPAAVGSAMTLTSGERTAIANEVETQIIDEADAEKVLEAITDKIAAVNPDLGGLTIGAIASGVRTNLATELGRIDANISSRGTGAALDAAGVRAAVGLGAANLDTQLADLPTNAELTTALGAADDPVLAQVALVKAKTDQLAFTGGNLNSNIKAVNDTPVTGTGETGAEWGPA